MGPKGPPTVPNLLYHTKYSPNPVTTLSSPPGTYRRSRQPLYVSCPEIAPSHAPQSCWGLARRDCCSCRCSCRYVVNRSRVLCSVECDGVTCVLYGSGRARTPPPRVASPPSPHAAANSHCRGAASQDAHSDHLSTCRWSRPCGDRDACTTCLPLSLPRSVSGTLMSVPGGLTTHVAAIESCGLRSECSGLRSECRQLRRSLEGSLFLLLL